MRRDADVVVRAVRRRHWLCFDLAADPTWRTAIDDPARVLPLAQAMLTWRSRHTDRMLADMLCERRRHRSLAADAGRPGATKPLVLLATVLALASAGLHAGWNLVAKRSADRFPALWGQFLVAGIFGAIVIAITRDLPADAWVWAAITGAVHVPYIVALARAYDRGDFSLAYPVARGGGALLAAIGGIVLLDDELSVLGVVAIATVVAGMVLLADRCRVGAGAGGAGRGGDDRRLHPRRQPRRPRRRRQHVRVRGVRVVCRDGEHLRRGGREGPSLRRSLPGSWRMYLLTGAVSLAAYGLVMVAVRRAPVGYVAALRESSVLVAAFIGWKYLDEGSAHRRLIAAGVVVAGLVLLVLAR